MTQRSTWLALTDVEYSADEVIEALQFAYITRFTPQISKTNQFAVQQLVTFYLLCHLLYNSK